MLPHAVGLGLWINWHDVAHNPPIHYRDYANHFSTVWSVSRFLEEGKLWGYSPYFHAGYPAGTIFDADNKAVELASAVLERGGMPLPDAFNAVVLFLIAFTPLAIYPAGRLLGLSRGAASLAQILGLAVWYGDPAASWTWRGGTLAFGAASFAGMLVVCGFWRWFRLGMPDPGVAGTPDPPSLPAGPASSHRAAGLVAWFGLGPLLFWLHPWAFFILGIPLAAAILVSRGGRVGSGRPPRDVPPGTVREGSSRFWLGVGLTALWAGWTLLLNWPWLGVLLRFLPTKTVSTQYLQGGLSQLAEDAQNPFTLLRIAVLSLAVAGILDWRRRGIRVWIPAGVSLAVWIGGAYGAVYLGAGGLQPYRFVIPALALATLPAAWHLERVWRRSPRRAGILLVLAALAIAPALYLGRPRGRTRADGTPRDHLSGPRPSEHAICEIAGGLDLDSGRILTNDWRFGAYLPCCCGAQVIGGPFLSVWTLYGRTNAGLDDILGRRVAHLDLEEMGRLLRAYNVRWIVLNRRIDPEGYTLAEWNRDHPGWLEPLASRDVFELFAVPGPSTWFFAGDGSIVARFNRLEVTGATPGGVGLKYHWIESLRTVPELTIRPVEIGDDPVPFLFVENGDVADFAIVQRY